MFSYESIVTKKKEENKQLPWVEKYRPNKIDNIISHDVIVQSLKKFIERRTLPHLLFFGPSGSGKTSTIMCCATEIYGAYIDCMVLHLNASNERGIETVRTKIKNFVRNKNSIFLPENVRNIFKLVILDEIDSMTVEAQGMLRQTIEKNSETTRFCLICNEIDKINIALQSRCALFRFSPLKLADMKSKLELVCKAEKLKFEDEAIDSIVRVSNGDMRSAINMLQSINLTSNKNVTEENVYKVSGHCMPHIITEIFDALQGTTKQKMNLADTTHYIIDVVNQNNITIFNLVDELKNIVLKSKFTNNQKIYLINNFARIEVYDSVNVDVKNVLMSIISLFVLVTNYK